MTYTCYSVAYYRFSLYIPKDNIIFVRVNLKLFVDITFKKITKECSHDEDHEKMRVFIK